MFNAEFDMRIEAFCMTWDRLTNYNQMKLAIVWCLVSVTTFSSPGDIKYESDYTFLLIVKVKCDYNLVI